MAENENGESEPDVDQGGGWCWYSPKTVVVCLLELYKESGRVVQSDLLDLATDLGVILPLPSQ